MPKANFLNALVSQLSAIIPAHLSSFKEDFEKNCHRILNNTFAKFELVTREEFDTQSKVLQRTRSKLEELEKHVKELESLIEKNHRT